MPSKMKALIIGGGITGLALGWYLKQRGVDAPILEKSCRPGGWIRTSTSDGFLFEHGPRSLRPRKVVEDLIKALGIENEVIDADPSAKRRFLYVDGKLRQMPHSFLGTILKGAWKDLWTAPSVESDESVHSFFARRFGSEAADLFADAMVAGIYAGDAEKLSMKCCFPKFYEMEQKSGSLVKGMLRQKRSKGSIYSFRNGMQTLVDALAKQVDIKLSCEVVKITPNKDSVEVTLADGRCLSTEHVFLTLPSNALPQLFPNIETIPAASIATVNLGFRRQLLPKKGFGYLIPSKEHEDILGVVFDSCTFPQQNRHPDETRLTVMIGGVHGPDVETLGSNSLENIALHSIEKHLGIYEHPDAINVRVAQKAIPQYVIDHAAIVKKIESSLAKSPRITLLGSSFYGVAINDCIQNAHNISAEWKGYDASHGTHLHSRTALRFS